MSNRWYAEGAQRLMQGLVALDVDTIKVALVTSSYTPNTAQGGDDFYNDVSANVVGTPQTLTGKSVTGGVFDASDVTFTANAESVGQMFPFTLQAGDTGVQSVQSLTCSVSSGTAGNIGITLLRRIASLGLPVVNIENSKDWAALGLARIYDSSCLALMVQCTATKSGVILGSYQYTQG